MNIIHVDKDIIVCIKPAGILSTDEPGGLPELLRCELGNKNADIRTVHRLDRVVSGLMVLARNHAAASELSRQIREGGFSKFYLACVHGQTGEQGELRDLMYRDKARRMSFVTDTPGPEAREAVLKYRRTGFEDNISRVEIELLTGRTHQIRCQFASRGLPLLGERKYSELNDSCALALWSERIAFTHPSSGRKLSFEYMPPDEWPWNIFTGQDM